MSAKRILVVDDDAALLRLLRLSLQGYGFEVTTATNGEEALEKLRKQDAPPSVVVLDLEMPVMDGREFYQEMRAAGSCVPVLVLSAYGARRAQRELKAQAFMSKPFEPAELSAAIEKLADSKGTAAR